MAIKTSLSGSVKFFFKKQKKKRKILSSLQIITVMVKTAVHGLSLTVCIFLREIFTYLPQATLKNKMLFLISIVFTSQRFIILSLSLINLEVSLQSFCLDSFNCSFPQSHISPLQSVLCYLRTGQVKNEGSMFQIHTN